MGGMELRSILWTGLRDKFYHNSLFFSQSSDMLILCEPVSLLEKLG